MRPNINKYRTPVKVTVKKANTPKKRKAIAKKLYAIAGSQKPTKKLCK